MKSLLWPVSQLYHYLAFGTSFNRNRMDKGSLIISIDIDVGSPQLGVDWNGTCNKLIHDYIPESRLGEIEEIAIPLLAEMFDNLELPATIAFRGQITETDSHAITVLKDYSIKHDIGAHGYSHRTFTSLTDAQAEEELKKISVGMKRLGIEPKSFIFPKNRIAHLDKLEQFGYISYRGDVGFKNDRLGVVKVGGLYNICPSFFLGSSPYPALIYKLIDYSAGRGLPCHFWFHPADLGHDSFSIKRKIDRLIFPLLNHAKKAQKKGALSFETMTSIVSRIEEANC
jgi:hypothetical protein